MCTGRIEDRPMLTGLGWKATNRATRTVDRGG